MGGGSIPLPGHRGEDGGGGPGVKVCEVAIVVRLPGGMSTGHW